MKELILLPVCMQISQDVIFPLALPNIDIEWLLCCNHMMVSFVPKPWKF